MRKKAPAVAPDGLSATIADQNALLPQATSKQKAASQPRRQRGERQMKFADEVRALMDKAHLTDRFIGCTPQSKASEVTRQLWKIGGMPSTKRLVSAPIPKRPTPKNSSNRPFARCMVARQPLTRWGWLMSPIARASAPGPRAVTG
jgi:hypothetical protein